MITLREDQATMANAIRRAMGRHQSVLAQGPTGFGKTVMGAYIAQSATAKDNRVIFAVHRDNLIHQTALTFREFGIAFGYITSGAPYERHHHVHIASINTLTRRLERIAKPALLVIDEAHMAAAKTWAKVVEFYRAQGTKILGLSATPTRLDGKPLSDLFDTLVAGPSVAWLIEQGFLSQYRAYCPTQIDVSAVHTRAGDFQREELEKAVDRPSITGDAVKHYQSLADGTRAVAYCVSIAHSKHVAESFNAAGIAAAHIDGTTPKAQQREIIQAFADGRYQVLCNVELITTGFDLSAQVGRDVPIETIIGLRPTQSLALHLQMIGRGLRRKPKPAVILDHAGNVLRHGLPDDDREWTLDGRKKKARAKSADDALPIRQCEVCFAIHRPAPACPLCGFVYPIHARQVDEVDGALEEVDQVALRRERKREQAHAQTFDDLVLLARARGYKNPYGWASHIWTARQAVAA